MKPLRTKQHVQLSSLVLVLNVIASRGFNSWIYIKYIHAVNCSTVVADEHWTNTFAVMISLVDKIVLTVFLMFILFMLIYSLSWRRRWLHYSIAARMSMLSPCVHWSLVTSTRVRSFYAARLACNWFLIRRRRVGREVSLL